MPRGQFGPRLCEQVPGAIGFGRRALSRNFRVAKLFDREYDLVLGLFYQQRQNAKDIILRGIVTRFTTRLPLIAVHTPFRSRSCQIEFVAGHALKSVQIKPETRYCRVTDVHAFVERPLPSKHPVGAVQGSDECSTEPGNPGHYLIIFVCSLSPAD
jgi:hypothetical protein